MYEKHLMICGATGCLSSGSAKVQQALEDELAKRGLKEKFRLVMSGCPGFCEVGPIIVIYPDEVFYCRLKPGDIPELVEKHLLGGEVIERLLYKGPDVDAPARFYDTIPFYQKQKFNVLHNSGIIDPENIDEYIMRGGYRAFSRALKMEPMEVINEVKKSGLRGRGGAGFPTGLKWEFTYRAAGDKKYVVCNADEGDPGAFMDRSILEGDPHAVLEGMLIAARAIGSDEGYIYCRAEYPLAIKRLKTAIAQAEEYGLVGENILGYGVNFKFNIKRRGGGLRLRRRDGAACFHRRQAGNAPAAPAVPGKLRAVGQAHLHQQRGNLRQYSPHCPRRRSGRICQDRHRGEQGDQGLRPGGQDPQYRPLRGAHGDHAARDYLRYRRRDQGRPRIQGGSGRRPLRRLHPRRAA